MFQTLSLSFQERVVDAFVILTYLFYASFIVLGGMTIIKPELFWRLDFLFKLYIGLFLIIRYNPFFKTKFTSLDRKISFHAGILITITLLIKYIATAFLGESGSLLSRGSICQSKF